MPKYFYEVKISNRDASKEGELEAENIEIASEILKQTYPKYNGIHIWRRRF